MIIGIILALIAFAVLWYYGTKEQEDLNDAVSKMDDYNEYENTKM